MDNTATFSLSHHTHIQTAISERVAYIVLNRPPLNILTTKMMSEINETLDNISRLPPHSVSAIVLVAAPGSTAFSAGAAIEEHRPELVYQMLQEFHTIYRNLRILSKPVIGVVNGQVLGGGCELVAYCDLVIASSDTRFALPEVRVGIYPPMATILFPRLIGNRRTTQMILTGEVIDAFEAQRIGLINYVVSPDDLADKSEELLNLLRSYSGSVLEATRGALHTAGFFDVEAIMDDMEDRYLNQLMSLQDAREGLEAFLQKRKPNWLHR